MNMLFRGSVLNRIVRPLATNRLASTLAVIEHASKAPTPGTLAALTAAAQLGNPVTALVAGSDSADVASVVSKLGGIAKVLIASSSVYDHAMPETVAPLVAEITKKGGFSHVVAVSSAIGRNVVPRVGALLDRQPITDVVRIESADTFVRPIYAGNALQTVQTGEDIKLLTVRGTAFEPAVAEGNEAPVESVEFADPTPLAQFVSESLVKSERPDLGSAPRVVSGGRGLKSKENFENLMNPLADALGAAVGASRAAVDSGYCDNSLQVGQTGKVVAPELYMAVGISGAIQHLAGMKDAKVIVAINKDEDAPIFHVADIGLVADLFDVVPEITSKAG